jgi:eukaryotic-like serine/threonine-protein kinase
VIRLANRFVLEREIGSGGMSQVFLGRDEVLDRPVAVKILKPDLEGSDVGARFRREGRTAARLSHPNIVQVYDAGEAEFEGRETSYIVMEYVPGGDLKQLMDERGALSSRELAMLSGVAAGLAHAHERGVIHRDIKPHNILLDEAGSPKLTDFGIARALDATQSTRTGSFLGTALYSSPEQLRGEEVTPKSDIYSLGATLYHAATGRTPFVGAPIEVASQHVNREPTAPRQINDNIGPSLEALILDCLGKDPDSRPTADEVRIGLLEAGRAPAPPPSHNEARGPSGGAVYGRRRRPAMAALAVLALLVLSGLVALPALLDGDLGANPQGGSGGKAANAGGKDQGGQQTTTTTPSATATSSASSTASPQSSATSQASADPGGSPAGEAPGARAAERTVEEFYASAARGNYQRSSALLSPDRRQSAFPSQASFQVTFGTLQSIEFVQGPDAEVTGDTATVTGVTEARHTDRIERNEGTWRLVNVGGSWRIDGWDVNPLGNR